MSETPPPDASTRAALSVEIEHRVGNDTSLRAAFEVRDGVTVLFGASGSGKTTTLLTIAGLVHPKHGKIKLGNEIWLDTEFGFSLATHRRKIAFVFQAHALFPHMTALANVMYGMNPLLAGAEKATRARALLDQWRVPQLADRKPRTFSGGEAQRVALARAFATSPRVVLMDEPFSALDETLRAELTADVKTHIKKLGVPALFVTHNIREAEVLGDRAIVLEKGRIVRQGEVATTLSKPHAG